MFKGARNLFQDLLGLLYPRLCAACDEPLKRTEHQICLSCDFDLPYTDFHLHQNHPLAKQFWGRVPVNQAMALLYYTKGSRTQHLLHQLKYQNQPEIGILLGKKIGEKLKANGSPVQVIIPVPLHPTKERARGYNQSEYLARGIASVLQVPVESKLLRRMKATETQTKKDRYTRVENMAQVFKIIKPGILENKHILLVDDVITSGATLEACALVLSIEKPASLNIAAAAYTQ